MTTASALILARDEEGRVAETVRGARAACDSVLVADAGSTDGTARAARAEGARVVPVPWTGDFAAARNAALAAAGGDAVLVLDCDETLSPAAAADLRGLTPRAAVEALTLEVRDWGEDPTPRGWVASAGREAAPAAGYVSRRQVRLFPRRSALAWRWAWEEDLTGSLAESGIPIRQAPVAVDHLRLLLGRPGAPAPEGLVEALRSALHAKPGDTGLRLRLVRALRARGDERALEAHLLTAARHAPGEALPRALLGDHYRRAGSWRSAIRQYQAVASLDPTDPWSLAGLAYARLALGDARGARDAAKTALSMAPTYPEAFRIVGLALGEMGKVAAGLEAVGRALTLAPRHAGAHYAHGVLLHRKGVHREAARAFETVLGLDPRHVDALHALGALRYQHLEDPAGAKEVLRRALELHPDHVGALGLLAQALNMEGCFEDALRHLRRVGELDPKNAQVFYKAGAIYLKRDQPLRALRHFIECLRRDPLHLEAHQQIARVYLAIGRPAEAARELRTAVRKDPNYAIGYYDLGVLFHRLGDPASAGSHFRKFLDLAPEHALAPAVRRELGRRTA
ncbi:MAG: tetratricopeptide repeat protein [Planctomycetes bacterium]|nr:tetratricopeptide repeat protein [Planctomycetota bacterium]